MKRSLIACMLMLGFIGAASPQQASAQATLKIYVNMLPISGSSVDPNHQEWVDAYSLSQVFEPGLTSPCRVDFVKGFDKAGPRLWEYAATGRHLDRVEFHVTSLTGTVLYKIVLEMVMVASIKTEAGNAFGEGVGLQAYRVRWTGYTVAQDGTVTGTTEAFFDCGKNLSR